MQDNMKSFPKNIERTLNTPLTLPATKIEDGPNPLEGEVVNSIIPSIIIDNWTRLDLFRWKLSGHTDTLTAASNLIDDLYKKGEIQNEQEHRDALYNFCTIKMKLPRKLLVEIVFNT